jgi:hypothetical protein
VAVPNDGQNRPSAGGYFTAHPSAKIVLESPFIGDENGLAGRRQSFWKKEGWTRALR